MKSVKTRNKCITLIPHKGPQSASLAGGEVENTAAPFLQNAPVRFHMAPGMQQAVP